MLAQLKNPAELKNDKAGNDDLPTGSFGGNC
jgi:hypothetical protein